mmetsp:Transcript_45463/g.113026  ORF Transcript_45463/g.113026 Transcript_45463/m.113026 type:complete len:215 (+) Transcript_45463:802-1446(+)
MDAVRTEVVPSYDRRDALLGIRASETLHAVVRGNAAEGESVQYRRHGHLNLHVPEAVAHGAAEQLVSMAREIGQVRPAVAAHVLPDGRRHVRDRRDAPGLRVQPPEPRVRLGQQLLRDAERARRHVVGAEQPVERREGVVAVAPRNLPPRVEVDPHVRVREEDVLLAARKLGDAAVCERAVLSLGARARGAAEPRAVVHLVGVDEGDHAHAELR